VLLSAYFLLLQAYTGRDDLLIGVPVANRAHGQSQDLIGCFINSLALDFEIDRDDDVESLIKKVGARVAEAQEYQQLPFERLVAELDLPADPSRHPLFQIWFDVNSFAVADADRAAARHESAPAALLRTHAIDGYTPDGESAVSSKLDLGLVVNDGGESLVGTITYASSLFDQCTVERFASTYQSILTQFARAI
jgi:non-ribosomal peptide synthetase component F